MDHSDLHARARRRGVNPIVYWLMRSLLQPFAHLYWRLSRIGREHIPAQGPFIIAANHRSFLDPFVIALMARRPIYFMTKKEAFINRPAAWLLSSLGAYPIDRGGSDQDAMATTKAILERGDGVLIFPECTRTRPGALGRPKRGVGRLALEAGVPIVPVAVIGTEAVRNGWRVRPHKVRIRAGALSGHEATWLESAGRRRFGGGVDLEAGRVRLHDGSVVAIPLGDLERFVVGVDDRHEPRARLIQHHHARVRANARAHRPEVPHDRHRLRVMREAAGVRRGELVA